MEETGYRLITDADGVAPACEELSRHAELGFDTETTSLSPFEGRLRLVQFASAEAVYVFDLFALAPTGDAATSEALEPLRRLLTATRPVKIAHNAKFDAKWVAHYLGVELCGDFDSRTNDKIEVERGGLFDTLLASQLVSAGEQEDRHGLASVAERYLGQAVDKTQQVSDWSGELSGAQLEYAARDAALMLPLRAKLVEALRANALTRTAQLEFECVAPLAAMELAGVYLDRACWRAKLKEIERRRDELHEQLQDELAEESAQQSFFGPVRADINLDSHVQLTRALTRLGVPVPDSTRNWKLEPLAAEFPVVGRILEYRTLQKTLKFGETLLDSIDKGKNDAEKSSRIHPHFHQIGAPTGRMSCLAGDTLISTDAGLKPMRDIKEGDRVKTSYGFKRVEKSWSNGLRQLYRVHLKDGRSIRATADHKFLTGHADVWKRLDEFRQGDRLFVSLKSAKEVAGEAQPSLIDISTSEARARKPVNLPNKLSVELCELMGLIIADGFLGRRQVRPAKHRRWPSAPATYDRVCIAFDRQDADLIERVILYGVELFGRPFVPFKSRTCHSLQLASTKVAEFLAALGLAGNAHTKAVPEIILSAPPIYRAAFLRGLFEGDGNRSDNSVGLTSVNSRLLAQVQLLLSEFGIYSIISRRNDTSGFAGSNRFDLKIHKKFDVDAFFRLIGFISHRKRMPFEVVTERTDGIPTPFVILGAQLYREAVAAGTTTASRAGLAPFAQFYKGRRIKGETVNKLISRFGMLPSLKPVADYLDLQLRPVAIDTITPDGVEEVYDITVEDVHEFVANSIVVHNCTDPNIQQIPHAFDMRRCFRAPEGRKLVVADYSQIELRILADFTGDPGFVEAFQSGADLHRVTAAQVFGVALDAVTKEQRDFAKRLNFGVVYGIGARRFALMTGLTQEQSEDLLRRYFATYRGLDTWLREAAQKAVRERTAPRTVAGRLFRFNFDPDDKQAASLAQRNGKNSPIQGSSADIVKRALRLLHDQLRGTGTSIVNVVHDEIVVETSAADAEQTAKTVEAMMCAAGEEYVRKVPINVETKIADEWVK
jgi:DNA polymerase I-like protein with 3'-5' exonuclease and polymerase domains/intein/homing endonuclease